MPIEPTKWAIECQICPWSLTIVYGEHEGENPEKIKDHLAELMLYHLRQWEHHHSATVETTHVTKGDVVTWVVRLKPQGHYKAS